MKDEEIIKGAKLIANHMGWKYQYDDMLIAHGSNSFYSKLLCTRYPLDIQEDEPNVVHYDNVYGYKCSLNNSAFIYILDRDKTDSYLIHNSLQQECNYNLSWDWLIPVVQKICSEKYYDKKHDNKTSVEVEIAIGHTTFTKNSWSIGEDRFISSRCSGNSMIEHCWYAVIDYIKRYNENNVTILI